ncbi:biotin carboxyl carrier domain-containing protein [Muricauda ruestringensis]|uniref:Biotin carboxyl carrier protein of acetyl-CoA carboxylase n=1 Tax=Flagellimonas aurea TaxID=2915619 RepID=A0ABS3G9E0_9FLAO|nr:acetyl-CoA carboxylase [Allomuricauda aurea]MBO0356047.1 biotin carboxyl carrier domain-containing protein [Allomuricauda aurea]
MSKIEITAPMPGVFYTKSSPDSEVYKKPGDPVRKDDIICLIEVMKTYNQIVSEHVGTFVSYEVENEELVMVGQVLAIIEVD